MAMRVAVHTEDNVRMRSASHSPIQAPAFTHRSTPPSQNLIQRKADHCACGGGCPRCQAKSNFTISQPNDPAEIEADQIADKVMRMPVHEAHPTVNTSKVSDTIHRQCDTCEAEDEMPLQRKPLPSSSDAPPGSPDHVRSALSSGGCPLDSHTRGFFEPRFGYDLSGVRIHIGSAARQSAEAINARAYTLGSDIVFGSGEFKPESESGKHLLAHELVHVAQRGNNSSTTLYRVPSRSGISDGRYSYSNNCGWIDWSHAVAGLATPLINRVQVASDALRAAVPNPPAATGDMTTPAMTSTVPHVGAVLSSASLSVRLLRPLSDSEVLEVALSLFKKLSIVFEAQQEWTDLIGSSSFSQEDLPSNLIGFYRAARGFSRSAIGTMCDETSVDEALAEYDRDHDFERNRSFSVSGISGSWPTDLSTINDSQASALYDIRSISAQQGTSSFQFCPMYRIEGTIGATDLFIISVGGTRFTPADNVRVVPTFRFYEGTHGAYGHTTFIEVKPNGQGDFLAFSTHGLTWPMYVPQNILVCLGSQGNPVL